MLNSTFLLYNQNKIYKTHKMYPSGTQTCCWDVIYNIFSSYIVSYITRKCYIALFWPIQNWGQTKIIYITTFARAVGRVSSTPACLFELIH